jgi:hypothetical protein
MGGKHDNCCSGKRDQANTRRCRSQRIRNHPDCRRRVRQVAASVPDGCVHLRAGLRNATLTSPPAPGSCRRKPNRPRRCKGVPGSLHHLWSPRFLGAPHPVAHAVAFFFELGMGKPDHPGCCVFQLRIHPLVCHRTGLLGRPATRWRVFLADRGFSRMVASSGTRLAVACIAPRSIEAIKLLLETRIGDRPGTKM